MLCGTQVTEGVLGAPFLLEDPANQFLRLKRHIYLHDYWKPDHSPNTWGNTLVDQELNVLVLLGPGSHPYSGWQDFNWFTRISLFLLSICW
ncbi:hypothetical protein FD755_022031 [Muntiacus reevesi]|uniref:Uncharacterized protein n=1 Tax=Muntiacus reevesi TaxID=9886 RepID=A0A5N3W5B1_MUNRE|nr:hypothetical protein FD755_022031 [Muntiacus reevesi]